MRLSDFELFCERHQSGMFYIACNVLGDSQKAEDAVQEALFRIYRTFGKLSFRTAREERVYALRAAKMRQSIFFGRTSPVRPWMISVWTSSPWSGETPRIPQRRHTPQKNMSADLFRRFQKRQRPFSAIDPSACPTRKSPRHCLSLRIMSGRLPFGPGKS